LDFYNKPFSRNRPIAAIGGEKNVKALIRVAAGFEEVPGIKHPRGFETRLLS